MQDYFQWKQSNTAPSTLPNYERWIRRFHTFLNTNELHFGLEDIGRFKAELQKTYSPKNIQYGLSILRDYIGYNIAVHDFRFPLHLFKIKQERSNSHQPITKAQFELLFKAFPANTPQGLQRKLMLSMLFDTGMRVGELLSIKIQDLKNNFAVIHNEKNTRSRLIAWSERTELLLDKYVILRKHLLTKEEWLFVSFRYKPSRKMTSRQVERIVREACVIVGIKEPIRPHSFRHGFVHRKLEEGKPITTVAQMLGHASSMNVMNYARLTGKEIQDAWEL